MNPSLFSAHPLVETPREVFYLVGFVVKCSLKHINCQECRSTLVDDTDLNIKGLLSPSYDAIFIGTNIEKLMTKNPNPTEAASIVSEVFNRLKDCRVFGHLQCHRSSLLRGFKVVRQPWDTLKVCVPSFLYVIQNNLLYTSASNLDAATYQVTYQLKILTTALFSVLILKRKLIPTQWFALVILLVGVVSVQLADTQSASAPKLPVEQNRLLGFSAALCACALSGYAGIFFEKVLKGSDISVWVRNVQLSFLSLPLGLFTTFVSDYSAIRKDGFFFGYDGFVIYVIILQAVGGLIVAMVVKYADNILKGFATSLAIIISCIASIYLFNFILSFQFVVGVALVISSIYAYNYRPPDNQKAPV